ncbi:MAG TPA: phosphoglycerate dehydrogenase [Candidatus Polarisedimenticolia bacterium]|jgi:D-3-phosphoglycerate dehydrogenase|nr:phosphoglycerate dehydrogenase [Candidatus Polarisedimenticolia bacterium]
MSQRVVIADPVAPVCGEILSRAGLEVIALGRSGAASLREAISGAAGLVVRSETKVTDEVLAAAPALKVVGRAGTGVDNIDVAAATRRGIVVMNAPGENTIAAAEHTLSLMLSLARNIPRADRSLKAGKWDREKFLGVELLGKILGVVGLGKVGREVAARARAFGMEICGFDPFLPEEVVARLGFQMLALPDLIARADFLTVHVPLNAQTRRLIGPAELGRCKPGLRIVNCARGGIVDEQALEKALQDGRVAGAALDVFEKEPPGEDHPLVRRDTVVATPHLGASTLEAQEKVAARIAEQIVAYLERGSVAGAVNVEAIDPEVLRVLGPWLDLAERLGRLQSRMAHPAGEEVTIEFSGALLDHPVPALVAAFLKGYLQGIVTEPVNRVNAALLAREIGLRVNEVRSSDSSDYSSLITTRLRTGERVRTIAGTLFGKRDLRIVRLDDYDFDAVPSGEMLICSNDDRPGMVGSLGTILGEAGINIAQLSLGRDRSGGRAIAILNLDSPVAPDLLSRIRHLSGILWAEQVSI